MLIDLEDKIKELIINLDKETFFINFLELYSGVAKSAIKKVKNVSVYDGLENKTKFLIKAEKDNLLDNYIALENEVLQRKTKPRYIIVTDFNELYAKDTKTLERLAIKFEELPQNFSFFLAWNNIEKVDYEKENPMDVKAAERFSRVYDELVKQNPDLDSEDLNLFLIRILFCLFAEDTDIFPRNKFSNDLKTLTKEDGSDTNVIIKAIFEKLSTNIFDKEKIASYLVDYPYVNGNLFSKKHVEVNFDYKLRKLIIEAGEMLNWAEVNPDILGSMLQAVANSETRSTLGMHYTSVPNIMKVIKPLFLDELYSEFFAIRDSELKENTKLEKLEKLLDRVGKMKFFDPACGSGNFLIIVYKELRRLEIEIYELIAYLKRVNFLYYKPVIMLSQFYGIEIDDFAHDVAMLSLWIADHQMNIELKERLQNAFRNTLPLQKVGAIKCANSLKIDWNEVCPHTKDEEVFVFGNPPYAGTEKQNSEQKRDLEINCNGMEINSKMVDYISGWFIKGARYINNTKSELAFVSTNSICQGEQVAYLWKPLLNMIDIFFAYTSFKWKNNAKHNAGVTVIIVGLKDKNKEKIKNLYIETTEKDFSKKEVKNINPYLADGENIIIEKLNKPISFREKLIVGCRPNDGGNLIFSKVEYQEIINDNSNLKECFRPFIGGKEFLEGTKRYCLWLNKELYEKYKNINIIKNRVEKNKLYRKNKGKLKLSETPWAFESDRNQDKVGFLIPQLSSNNRYYVPIGLIYEDEVISDPNFILYEPNLWEIAILQSKMHLVWLQNIGGKLETRYRYSASLVYNTFPVPKLSEKMKERLEEAIIDIIDFRDENGGTLAELYGSPLAEKNPKPMNEELLNLHKYLDKVVDSIYSEKEFKNDEERLALLLKMYKEKMEGKDGR